MRSRTKLTDKIKISDFDMAGIIEKWLIHHHVEVENFFYNWPESRSLTLDAMVLSKINADMIEYVIEKPEKVLGMVHGILLSDAVDNPTDSFIDFPEIRIRNIPNRITPSGIRDGDVGTLVAVECQVRSASKILPKAKVVFVRCVRCGHVWNVDVPYRGDPSVHVCPNQACNRTGPFAFIDEREVRTSSERFIIQDPFDAAVGSATAAFEMEVEGDLVDCARAGDRIIANCIVCTEKKSKSPIRSIYLKCISVETDTNAFDDKPLTKEEIESFHALGEQGNLMPQIVKSIAPDIYGMEDVKEAIALQLASCPSVPMDGGMKLRGDIHIFLIGDPGIAKSQLLRYVSKIAHRGRYTSGRGSTSAGLTATAVKDEDDRWSVEAGFLPLCHDGMAAIDEFNLMKAEDRSALLEAMESGTVSVSKASISATLPAKATILAAGNPVNSRIDVHVPIVEQINIPTTILSRFDLIFILLDSHNKEQDEALAHHIGALRRGTKSSIDPPISLELLRRYISHVKKLNDFQVTEEAEKMLIDFHLGMRSFNDYKGAVPVTPRQLEAMFRLATASARLRMSPSVDKQDAERAIRLSRASLLSSGIDPESGALDADAIYTGVPKSQADATKVIEDAIVDLCQGGKNAKLVDIISAASAKGIKPERVEKILDRLRTNGNIFSPADNAYRHTWRR